MRPPSPLLWLPCILNLAVSSDTLYSKRSLQPLPFSSSNQWIVDANKNHEPYVGINWPGAAEIMIPEGLQYQSISTIVKKISQTGFNTVRLTFAIELVDDILDNGGDVKLQDAFVQALGQSNGTTVLASVLKNNPQFSGNTTRLQVFDAIANELATQNIYLHLDNHVSKASWCCSFTDGNAWFGDTYFDTTKWIRGLTYLATHGKTQWPTFSSIGLRNELRPALSGALTLQPYTWSTWKTEMTAAGSAVHAANPDILIFFSGLLADFDISAPVRGSAPLEPIFNFSVSSLDYADKFVFELHQYDKNLTVAGCQAFQLIVDGFGANVTIEGPNQKPLVISEWGYDEDDASGSYMSQFQKCLAGFLVDRQLGWMMWVLAGSYYIRDGVQDTDETYGLLDHTWNDYRGSKSLAALKDLINQTYATYNQTVPAQNGSTSVTATPTLSTSSTGTSTVSASSTSTSASVASRNVDQNCSGLWTIPLLLAIWWNFV